jgi:hypothetical protein
MGCFATCLVGEWGLALKLGAGPLENAGFAGIFRVLTEEIRSVSGDLELSTAECGCLASGCPRM